MLDRHDRWLHAFTNKDGRWRFAADLDEIDPAFVERLVAVEDKRFYRHGGVDPLAILRAGRSALTNGEITSGASTITMQTARLLEPRARTLSSKVIEMARAAQLERRLSKREILELYLTLAPYGGNIEGVRAASLSYFGKEPSRLSDAEQALLIALPQAPEARRPDRRPAAARAARDDVIAKLASSGLLAPTLADETKEYAVPSARRTFPRAAYHTARELAARGAASGEYEISSTIDLDLQHEAEMLVAAAAATATDGATAAAIIVETKTRAVRAAVGSSGLDAAGGWIDLTMAPRSPGSTLKPFIYGLAFDDGLVGPATVIEDMPQRFDGYAPENFDRVFRGDVRVADALQHSLNVPAVALLARIGAPRLGAMLKAAGAGVRTPERADERLGLALALGGAAVTMRDLAALYAGLAEGGEVRPLAFDDSPSCAPGGFHIMTAESARRVSTILKDAPSLEGRAPAKLASGALEVAMKTGTSYGYRDAWAAGHAGGYAAIAWVGRADGASRPGVTGREAAAPLLAGVFDAVSRHDPNAGTGRPVEEPAAGARIAMLTPRPEARPPEIVFPPRDVELFLDDDARGFALAARSGAGGYRWYVGGAPVDAEPTSGRAMWTPAAPGFYDVMVVDRLGKSARVKVRVTAEG